MLGAIGKAISDIDYASFSTDKSLAITGPCMA